MVWNHRELSQSVDGPTLSKTCRMRTSGVSPRNWSPALAPRRHLGIAGVVDSPYSTRKETEAQKHKKISKRRGSKSYVGLSSGSQIRALSPALHYFIEVKVESCQNLTLPGSSVDQGHKELVGGVAILSASSAEGAEEGRGMKQSSFALTNAAVRRKEIGCSRFQSQHLLRGSSLFVLSFMPSAVRRMELVGRLAVWGWRKRTKSGFLWCFSQ